MAGGFRVPGMHNRILNPVRNLKLDSRQEEILGKHLDDLSRTMIAKPVTKISFSVTTGHPNVYHLGVLVVDHVNTRFISGALRPIRGRGAGLRQVGQG